MIVGEAPGEKELEHGIPFIGPSGYCLDNILVDAGLHRSMAFVTNVCSERPPRNDMDLWVSDRKSAPSPDWKWLNGRWVAPPVYAGASRLALEVAACRPRVILACGNLALWALTGRWGIKAWRSSILEVSIGGWACRVVPAYHPSAVLREWSLRGITVHDARRVATELATEVHEWPATRYMVRPSFEQARDWLNRLFVALYNAGRSWDTPQVPFSADIETRGGHIACIGFARSRYDSITIPLMCVERASGYWSEDEEGELVRLMRRCMTHPASLVIGQNWLYDAQYIWRHWGFTCPNVYDTMLAQHTMFSSQPKGLDYLGSLYDPHHVYWKDEGKEWDTSIPEDDYWVYNGKDCCKTFLTWEEQSAAREQFAPTWPKLAEVHEFQQSLFHPVLRTMNRGVLPAVERKAEFRARLQTRANEIQSWLDSIVGRPINIRSAPQMQALFYDELNMTKCYKRNKDGTMRVTVDDAALEKMYDREPLLRPIIRQIQALRSVGVFLSTFVDMRLDSDGRIRCSFNVGGTVTFRFSSSTNAFGSGTNLQNIPSGDDDGGLTEAEAHLALPNVRELFKPDPGMMWGDMDLDSADLRIVVEESGCQWMKECFNAGKKPYIELGKEYYRDNTFSKRHPRYRDFKALCHGSNYLGKPPALAKNTGLLVRDVERVQRWYFEVCPEIAAWQKDFCKQIESRRYVENIFGHRIWCFDRIEGNVFNEMIAALPQSTIACLINKAYVAIDRELPWCEILLQVHDSLDFQFPIGRPNALADIRRVATIPLPYPTPLTIPVGIKISSKSWGHCNELTPGSAEAMLYG